MNYNIQSRIQEIIDVFDRISVYWGRYPQNIKDTLLKAQPELVLNFTISEKANIIKESLIREYSIELKELEIKNNIIENLNQKYIDDQFDLIRPYFFDESFMKKIVEKNPDILWEMEKFIINDNNIKWKDGFKKLAIHTINNTLRTRYNISMLINRSSDNHYHDYIKDNDYVDLLFSKEKYKKCDLDEKLKKSYERNLLLDALENNGELIDRTYCDLNDKEIVLTALLNSGPAIRYIPEFKDDLLCSLFAIYSLGHAIKFVGDEFKDNEAIVRFAFNYAELKKPLNIFERSEPTPPNYEAVYPYISTRLKGDKNLALMVSDNYGYSLKFMSIDLQNDIEIAKRCIQNNGLAIQFASDEIKSDQKIALIALNQNPYAYHHLSRELKLDPIFNCSEEFIKTISKHNIEPFWEHQLKFKKCNKKTIDVVLNAIEKNENILNLTAGRLNKWLISNKKSQELYNSWINEMSSEKQEHLCGDDKISENERYFINNYAKINCLDLGCGSGKRTFPLYIQKNIQFTGIEKMSHLIENSKYNDKIIHKNLSSIYFQLDDLDEKEFDIAVCFGGVINGFIDNPTKYNGWNNLTEIARVKSKYLLVDTLSHFDWYNDPKKYHGEVIQLAQIFPPQFFYSEFELKNIFKKHNLKIVEEKNENIGSYSRTHYLLEYREK